MGEPIPFGEWRPDLPAISPWAQEALNVIAGPSSYRPLKGLVTTSNALNARCQGAAWFRKTDETSTMFAGTASKLYRLSGTTWSDVSRVAGGAYSCPSSAQWKFTQFGTLAICVNGADNPQKFDLSAGSNWLALGGSPPVAQYCATVLDFVFMGNITGSPQTLQWSGINNAELWGSALSQPGTQADIQVLPDGGQITGILGGEYGVVFSETKIRRATYQGGTTFFSLPAVADGVGCTVPGSLAGWLDLGFFVHKSGFYQVQGGQTVSPIGRDKVDIFFWKEFDETNQGACSSCIDPVRGLYIFSYPANGSSGVCNRLLIYNWHIAKWTHAQVTLEQVFGGVSQQSYTLEQLDPFGTVDTLPYSMDSSYWTGVLSLLLFGFDTTHSSGSFSGANLAAELQTNEFKAFPDGKRGIINRARPIVDGGSPLVSLGYRDNMQNAVAWGPSISVTRDGSAPVRRDSRYFRVKVNMGAGDTWDHLQSVDDLVARATGMR